MDKEHVYLKNKRYQIEYKLGAGGFGTVHKALDLKEKPPKDVAIKEIKITISEGCRNRKAKFDADLKKYEKLEDKIKEFEKFISDEINNSKKNIHDTIIQTQEAITTAIFKNYPFIIQYYDSFYEDETFFIVMEFCENGSLERIIQDKKEIDESTAIKWLTQAAVALSCIHENNVIHRDVKPMNIFLKNDDIRLGDFGLSVFLNRSYASKTGTGTWGYKSPEVEKDLNYNSYSDIWSLGITFYHLCTHKMNFLDGNNNYLDLPKRFSSEFNDLIKKMLSKDPAKRPSAEEINNTLEQIFKEKSLQKIVKNMNEFLNNPNSDHVTEKLISELKIYKDGKNQTTREFLNNPNSKIVTEKLISELKIYKDGKNQTTREQNIENEPNENVPNLPEVQRFFKNKPKLKINVKNLNKISFETSSGHKKMIKNGFKNPSFLTSDLTRLLDNLDQNFIPNEFKKPDEYEELIGKYTFTKLYFYTVGSTYPTGLVAWYFDNNTIEKFKEPGFFIYVDHGDFDKCFIPVD